MLAGLQVETTAVAETEGSEAAAISNKATNIVCDFPFHVPQPEHLSRVLLSGLSPCSLRRVRRPAVLVATDRSMGTCLVTPQASLSSLHRLGSPSHPMVMGRPHTQQVSEAAEKVPFSR